MSYLAEAQKRAQRRRSAWNLLLVPAVLLPLGLLVWGLVLVLQLLHQARYPAQALASASGFGPIFTTIGALLAAIPLSLLIGNRLVWLIIPTRRVLEHEATAVPKTDFVSAQRQLIRFGRIAVPVSLGLAVLGALVSW